MKKYTLKPDNQQRVKYAIDYARELNTQQVEAVKNIDGPQLVIAGAGSGKTRTLIYRVAFLVENNINPESILLLTFTRKAAQEMMRRAASILDERCQKVSGGTFHSFANFLLRKYGQHINIFPNFIIMDRSDSEEIIQLIRAKLELNKKGRRFPLKNTVMNIISKATNKCSTIEKVIEEEYPDFLKDIDDISNVANHYREFKQNKQVLDYDDLLVKLRELLETKEDIRKKVSNTYRYIMVDEYQDTNRLQADIAILLASHHHNILVVGDDSQSIYSFRGANFRNIMDFPKLYPDAIVNTLEQNYRSTKPILDLTNAIINKAKEKYSKVLFCEIEGGNKPVFLKAMNGVEQALFVAQRIIELREEGISLNKIAVLFRAAWHSNELEIELKNRNVPYVKYGGLKFTETAHVKDVLSFLRIIFNRFDEIAWLRVLMLIEGIGPILASRIISNIIRAGSSAKLITSDLKNKKYYKDLLGLQELLSKITKTSLNPSQKLEKIIEFYYPLFQVKYDDYKRRIKDFDSLVRISQRFSSLDKFLSEMVLEPLENTILDDANSSSKREEEKLVLSTIHSAKGLEWHTVFIIHLVDGYFPSTFSVKNEELIEEERRLFYVASTRAKNFLYLITPELESRSWSSYEPEGTIFSKPSRFLTEISNFEDLIESWVLDVELYTPF
jgi:DNA helicase-2/ATP-dependent DNA helicase PcrA